MGAGGFLPAVGDLERLPVADGRLDLAVSLLALQTVNDLPGALIQMRRSLKGDGLLMAAMIGGETLTELRQSLTIAESEIVGGASPRVAPSSMYALSEASRNAPGLALPVVDLDRAVVRYPDDVLRFLPTSAPWAARTPFIARSLKPLRRDILLRAAVVYAERFADPDGVCVRPSISSGWRPGRRMSQPKPLEPGSATMSLADA